MGCGSENGYVKALAIPQLITLELKKAGRSAMGHSWEQWTALTCYYVRQPRGQHIHTQKKMPMDQFLKTGIHGIQGSLCPWIFQGCQP